MTDHALPDETHPQESSPDAFEWTEEAGDPDVAGMPGEFINETGEDVPGVRRGPSPEREIDHESNN